MMIQQTFLKQWTIPRQTTSHIVVHTREKPTDAKSMDNWFRNRGYLQCGFHYCVTRGGIYETREQTSIGAHCPGFDDSSIAVSILGWSGKDADSLDPNTLANFNNIIERVSQDYPNADIVPATKLRRNNGGYEPFEEIVNELNARRRGG